MTFLTVSPVLPVDRVPSCYPEAGSKSCASCFFSVTTMTTAVKAKTTNRLLVAYLAQLSAHPLRTKAFTVGTFLLQHFYWDYLFMAADLALLGALCFLQDVLASHFAGVPSRKPLWVEPAYKHLLARAKVDSKSVKMALYGFFVSAPLGHYLVGWLQKAFAGRTGASAKLGQIIASNLIIAPIQAAGMPYINVTFCLRNHVLSSVSCVHGGN
jgi:hypothetical protein